VRLIRPACDKGLRRRGTLTPSSVCQRAIDVQRCAAICGNVHLELRAGGMDRHDTVDLLAPWGLHWCIFVAVLVGQVDTRVNLVGVSDLGEVIRARKFKRYRWCWREKCYPQPPAEDHWLMVLPMYGAGLHLINPSDSRFRTSTSHALQSPSEMKGNKARLTVASSYEAASCPTPSALMKIRLHDLARSCTHAVRPGAKISKRSPMAVAVSLPAGAQVAKCADK
jgi:hypothetical protein